MDNKIRKRWELSHFGFRKLTTGSSVGIWLRFAFHYVHNQRFKLELHKIKQNETVVQRATHAHVILGSGSFCENNVLQWRKEKNKIRNDSQRIHNEERNSFPLHGRLMAWFGRKLRTEKFRMVLNNHCFKISHGHTVKRFMSQLGNVPL